MGISTAIRSPTDDLANHKIVLTQLKETTELAQRLRGDPLQSFVRVSELVNAGIMRLANGVLVSPSPSSLPVAAVPSTRKVSTIGSLTGGGALSSDLTIELVNDSASPGNSMLYGTNGSGVKGWYTQPSGGGSGTVTSVGLTSTDFTVSGSPVTTAGNITANLATQGGVTAGAYTNANVTVNSKGVVTAVANGTAPALVKIAETVLGSAAANVTFSSIPATYRSLVLRVTCRGSSTATNFYIQFNGDTAANYDDAFVFNNGNGASSGVADVATATPWAGACPASTAPANNAGQTVLTIHNYAATTFFKSVVYNFWRQDSTAVGGTFGGSGGFQWRSTAAISSILISPTTGNFVTGSTFSLYGET